MKNKSLDKSKDYFEIPVLHGFRAIFIFLVANFHIWQQSWLPQYVFAFNNVYNFDFLARSGYVFVDGMILISAALMFLPYAKNNITKTENIWEYYIKKIAKIIPSYIFNVLFIFFVVALPQNIYPNPARAVWDFFSHIFFAQTYSAITYIQTPLNPGLWTVVILLQGYLIMPFIMPYINKKPLISTSLLILLAWAYRYYIYNYIMDTGIWINQLPAFLDVYALGFISAKLFVKLKANNMAKALFSTLLLGLAIVALVYILKYQASMPGLDAIRLGQLKIRFALTLILSIIMLSAHNAIKPIIWLLSNKLIRFLATISYNFYIWHQFIAVQMRIRYYDTETLHHSFNMQHGFTLLCYSFAIIVAMFVTYYIELPMAKLTLSKYKSKRRNNNEGSKRNKVSEYANKLFNSIKKR